MTIRRVGVVAYHSSPLTEPGAGDAGGMTVYIRGVARALADLGVETDVFTRSSRRGTVHDLSPGVRVIGIDAGPRRALPKESGPAHLAEFVSGVRAFRAAHRVTYDVMHSHYWQSGLAALHLSAGAPHVHSNHTLSLVKAAATPGSPEPGFSARVRAEVDVVGAADILVAATQDEARSLTTMYGAPPERVVCVPLGVDHDVFKPGDRSAARRVVGVGDEAVLLYVGRIQPLKGIDLAIRATAEVVSAVERDVVLMIVGGPSGPEGESELRHLHSLATSLGLGGRVRFVGPQPHEGLPLFYRAADAVIVPSHSESFGLAALEAHACGVPVVSTAVGAAREVIAHGSSGFVVDERDPSLMAGYVKTVLGERSAFGDAAARQATRFAWTATAAELHALYSRLVSQRVSEACSG